MIYERAKIKKDPSRTDVQLGSFGRIGRLGQAT
jgi:hypothetical protein